MGARNQDRISHGAFAACAAIVILAIAAIFFFVGANAYETFTVRHISPLTFLFSPHWSPDDGLAGALIPITGTIVITLVALVLGTPLSVGLAIFITQIAPPWARRMMRPVLELFIGIPSVIYGLLGLEVLVPIIANIYNTAAGGFFYNGYGAIAASLVLAIMIFPTITALAVDALGGLPNDLREASMALGATRWQTIRRTLLPAASSGIYTGVILGTGRAIGETLAVSYVIGSNPNSFPLKFDSVYPYIHFLPTDAITVRLLTDFKEAVPGSLNYDAIWTLAFVLLLISFLLVVASRTLASRSAFTVRESRPRRVAHAQTEPGGSARSHAL
ncbi:MAG TPA: phosphate ABC transporter permease subunit PstC [Ktedonobacterales bacterium]|nr:phosphate ABC transporter permease subunit PstC [Ktedonobacterales bacterium]